MCTVIFWHGSHELLSLRRAGAEFSHAGLLKIAQTVDCPDTLAVQLYLSENANVGLAYYST